MIKQLQWCYDQLTIRNTEMSWLGHPWPPERLAYLRSIYGPISFEHKRSAISESFPYTVPKGYQLGIEMVQFACKVSSPASYCIITNAFSVSANYPFATFPLGHPFMMPEGAVINALFINNTYDWDQWMNVLMLGTLYPVEWGLG